MHNLKKVLSGRDDIISFGNMFLIGNGHLGYRGTLEEYSKEEMVALNVVGEYDKYGDKWRESINMPNPFKVNLYLDNKEITCIDNYQNTTFNLDIKKGIFKRSSYYNEVKINSERFIPFGDQNIILFKYTITPLIENIVIKVKFGLDLDIYDINGPHFKTKEIYKSKDEVFFKGITNEEKIYYESVKYLVTNSEFESNDDGYFTLNTKESIIIYAIAKISGKIEKLKLSKNLYSKYKSSHFKVMNDKWDISRIELKGKKLDQFYIDYSIYHLLILGNECYNHSIPARGVSGQTYKGAVFWDTEIFLLPFYTLTNPLISKRLLEYRIKTLPGAIKKAKEFGYDGAFYAWESQDTGLEACSKYNVTDPITGSPIRTYFNEKQIHISSDIAYAFINYIEITSDYSILNEGALDVLKEIIKFNMSYARKVNGKYHLCDVIGPDEYHERIDDNAFTTYMAYFTGLKIKELLLKYDNDVSLINKIDNFLNNLYLPVCDNNNIIEQFSGYNNLEDTTVEVVRSRLRHEKDYWGGKYGVATPTKVIKQADVVTLLVLEENKFNSDILKANFDYYYKYTEHGSSLSSSMYSILASKIGYTDIAYKMFIKSASIDLGLNQKMYAGGIYIGGTHPASNAGAYLSVVYGMAGLRFNDNGFSLNPHLPKEIKGLSFKLNYKNKIYKISIDESNNYIIN